MSANPFEVTLSWDALSAADSYKIVYNLPGGYWQSVTVTDTFLTLSHDGNGFAYFYVRSNCGDGFISPYSNVQIIDLPSCPTSIDIESDVLSFCEGGNATLSVSSDYASYQWYEGDEIAVDDATSSSLTTTSSGSYYVVATTSEGCELTSQSITISVTSLSAVSSLETEDVSSTSVFLDWNNSSPTGVYDIVITSSDGDVMVDEDSYSGSSLTLTGLSPSTTYDVVQFEHEGQTYRKAFVGCTYHCG